MMRRAFHGKVTYSYIHQITDALEGWLPMIYQPPKNSRFLAYVGNKWLVFKSPMPDTLWLSSVTGKRQRRRTTNYDFDWQENNTDDVPRPHLASLNHETCSNYKGPVVFSGPRGYRAKGRDVVCLSHKFIFEKNEK